jgi:hypothetical protein
MPNVKGGHGLRRGGARQTVSDKVIFRPLDPAKGAAREGWALNESRGGLRAILEEDTGKVELGEEYEIIIGESPPKRARIVWLQEEPDGFVVGVEYVGLSGMHRAAAEAAAAVDVESAVAEKTGAKRDADRDADEKKPSE